MISIALIAALATQAAPAAPMKADERGRPLMEMSVNGQGPFDFVVDTAAERTVITTRLVDRLGLTPGGGGAHLHGASGAEPADTYILDRLESPVLDREATMVTAFPNTAVISAWGVLGMDAFTRGRLVFDKARGQLKVEPSGPASGGVVLPLELLRGSFAVTTVEVDGRPVRAVIDSGAGRTLMNTAALAALGWQADDPRLAQTRPVQGATSQQTAARSARIGRVLLGPMAFEEVSVVVADLPVFQSLGLADGPAMILGSDLLGRLPAYAIDYPRSELQLTLPAPSTTGGPEHGH